MKKLIFGAVAGALLSCAFATQSLATSCVGNCGTLGPARVVTGSPASSSYNYVSTKGGVNGEGQIPGIVSSTNGSLYPSNSFTGNVGDKLEFYFNLVTSDGSKFSDHAWAALLNTSINALTYLFTARTQPVGDTSPGFGLPVNEATLTPATSGIIGVVDPSVHHSASTAEVASTPAPVTLGGSSPSTIWLKLVPLRCYLV